MKCPSLTIKYEVHLESCKLFKKFSVAYFQDPERLSNVLLRKRCYENGLQMSMAIMPLAGLTNGQERSLAAGYSKRKYLKKGESAGIAQGPSRPLH